MAFDAEEGYVAGLDLGNETQPLGEFLRSLLRFLPVVLAGAALLAMVVYFATAPAPPAPIAESQIGLTNEVVWPFFDVAKRRAMTQAEDPAFEETLRQRLGGVTLNEFDVESDDTQILIRLIAVSDTPEDAVLAANTAAELLIDMNSGRVSEDLDRQIERLEAVIADSERRVTVIDGRLEELVPLEAEAQARIAAVPESTTARESLISVSTERSGLNTARAEEIRQQVSLNIELDELRSESDTLTNELELVAPALPPSEAVEERSLVPPLAAFVGAIVAGLGLAVVWDRSRGVIRSPWYIEQLVGVRSIGRIETRNWEQSMSVVLANLIAITSESDQKVVAVAGLPRSRVKAWHTVLIYYLSRSGYRVIDVTDDQRHSDSTLDWAEVQASRSRRETMIGKHRIVLPSNMTILDAPHMRPVLHDVADSCQLVLINAGVPGSEGWDRAVALADAIVLVVTENRSRVSDLRATAATILGRQSRLLGTILVPSKLPDRRSIRMPADRERPTKDRILTQ